MQSDWLRAFSITIQELYFFTALWSSEILNKVVYHLKPKHHIDGPNLFSKSVSQFFSEHLGHA